MGSANRRKALRLKRKKRIRKKLTGTEDRPRMSVFRSSKHIYSQIIDDTKGITLVTASTTEKEVIENQKFEVQRYNWQISGRPCLIFLHEGLGCVSMWKDFPGQLSDQTQCPALVFSRLGYGRSSPKPLPWKLNFMHQEAVQVLPKIIAASGIREYILVGHSDGGSIGIIFSGSPKLTKGLKGLITEAAHVLCETVSVDSIAEAKVLYETGTLKKGLEKYHQTNTENAFRGWNDVWLNPRFMQWNIVKYLGRIKVPMLALQGEDDQYGTALQLKTIQDKVKQVETCLIRDCRHSPHFEQPKITLNHMTRYIDKLVS